MQHSFLNAIYQSLSPVSGIGLWLSFGDYNSASRKDLVVKVQNYYPKEWRGCVAWTQEPGAN